MGRRSLYTGALGTSIVKVFDLAVAGPRIKRKDPGEARDPVHGKLHSFRLPWFILFGLDAQWPSNSFSVQIQVKPLGAQIVGAGDVDKRIDVLATAIHGGMTVMDLEELELTVHYRHIHLQKTQSTWQDSSLQIS